MLRRLSEDGLEKLRIGYRDIEIHFGDISEVGGVDAHVSSDDNWLSHGGGVSRALWLAAGPEVAADASELPALSLGDVAVTGSGALDSRLMLHAVTLDFDGGARLSHEAAVDLYVAVFLRCDEHELERIALPLLGSGAGRLGPRSSVLALVEALQRQATVSPYPGSIALVLYDDVSEVECEILRAAADAHASVDALVEATAQALAGGTELRARCRDIAVALPHQKAYQAVERVLVESRL